MKLFKLILWFCLAWILFTMVSSAEEERFATRYPTKWNKRTGKIPYKLKQEDFSQSQWLLITRTINYFNQMSCVKFNLVKPNGHTSKDFVHIIKSNSKLCHAYSGFKGGEQFVHVSDMCLKPSAEDMVAIKLIHELLHALGFVHEHQRAERDKFLRILIENIKPGKRRQFYRYVDKVLNSVTEFDMNSIMMYSEKAYSKNGNATIEPINHLTTDVLGQRKYLSELDRTKINLAYGCKHFHCSDPMDRKSTNMTYLVGSKYAQTCAQEGQRILGSKVRRCLYGNIWTGIKSICVPETDQVRYCNFEQECEDLLPENDYWERAQVFDLLVTRLEGDLTFGDHTGHVLVFEVGPENPRLLNSSSLPQHQLRSVWLPLDCADPSETRFHYCISFGHFTSIGKLQFRLFSLLGFSGKRFAVFDSYGGFRINEWRYEAIKMGFERCHPGVKLWLEFEVYVPTGSKSEFAKPQLVALDEVSVHRNGLC